ncbi:hypothetical protein SESBI_21797 [Sesbania bispinosa]|nr:hypothetical protein SESBI_21797 [Sesbania bispinosa]
MEMEVNVSNTNNEQGVQEEITVELETENLQSLQLARHSLIGKIFADKPLNKGVVRSILVKAWGEHKDIQITDMEVKNAAKIIDRFREVQEVENPEVEGRLLRTFIRVRALINIKNPLVTGCWVPRRDLPKLKAMSPLDGNVVKYSAKLSVPPAKSILAIAQEQGKDDSSSSQHRDSRHEVAEMQVVISSESADCLQKQKGKERVDPTPPLGLEKDRQSCLLDTDNLISANLPHYEPFYVNPCFGPQGPSVTKIDLKHGKERAGLGPLKLDNLNIIPEFIGLSNDPIILDYPSPTNNKYEGANLDPFQIRKCRKFISKKEHAPEKELNLGYTVEFPEDDEGETHTVQPLKLQNEDESQLILGWNNSLSLKRYREDGFVDASHLFDDLWNRQKRIRLLEEDAAITHNNPRIQNSLSNDSQKAEEAGLKLPHLNGFGLKRVQEGWTDHAQNSTGWDSYLSKIRNCKSALKRWPNRTFKRVDHQIFKLNEELQQLLNADFIEMGNNWERIQDIRRQIDTLRKQE